MTTPLSALSGNARQTTERHAPPQPLPGSDVANWALNADLVYLNHGCFGARLREVLNRQNELRDMIESSPVAELDRRRESLLAGARKSVASFVNMSPNDFGFVTNATNGVNAILRSLRFEPGDELLTTNHVYNAVRLTMMHLAELAGAKHVIVDVPFPIETPHQVIDAIERGITDRTRLVVVDHVTSPTAVVYPIKDIIELCHARGTDVLVDGAHVPGMLDLDIEALNPAYYVANLHKWVCAPMGAAFVWARPDRQEGLHPTTISHFFDQDMATEFNWQATRDITPWLCAAASIEAIEATYGWDAVRRHNHELATWVQQYLVEQLAPLGVTNCTPADGSMIGSTISLVLPEAAERRFDSPDAMTLFLYERHRIEVPVFEWNGVWVMRMSCQVYNRTTDYEKLAAVVAGELRG